MRYFAELAYNGTTYSGWQKQPNALTVQEDVEKALSTVLRTPIEVVGCGRTDSSVHAKQYFLHFDFEGEFPKGFVNRLNKFLYPAVSIRRIFEVAETAHARFDATSRSYEYHIDFHTNPFREHTIYAYPFAAKLDLEKMQAAASLLLNYKEFFPFCKSKSDVKTMLCDLTRAEWIYDEKQQHYIFYISANRFLRGMVRLIVGMCLHVGIGKVKLEDVKEALENQTRLNKSYSAPPHGLFLTDIRYPFLEEEV